MVKTPEELFSLVEGLRSRGVLAFRFGDLELKLLPDFAQASADPEELAADEGDEIPDHILFHSAG